jgi:tRNA-2-methylthio-N6-dimethylallyladenosine synthase
VKIERLERLVAVTQETARRRNVARIGSLDEVLVEGRSRTDASLLRGRSRRNTTVNFEGDAAPGSIVEVLVDGATSTTLRGRQRALAAV